MSVNIDFKIFYVITYAYFTGVEGVKLFTFRAIYAIIKR